MEHLKLHIGAPARLAHLRKRAQTVTQNTVNRWPDIECPPTTWKEVRYTGYHNQAQNYVTLTQHHKGEYWYCHTGQYFPREHYVDEYTDSYVNHTGWWADEHYVTKLRGLIVTLPQGRYLAGYEDDGNGERVYFNQVFDTPQAAIRYADQQAEQLATESFEYTVASSECDRLDEANTQRKQRVKELMLLRHHKCMDYAKKEIKRLIFEIRETNVEIRNLIDQYQ